jgi:TonB family protein
MRNCLCVIFLSACFLSCKENTKSTHSTPTVPSKPTAVAPQSQLSILKSSESREPILIIGHPPVYPHNANEPHVPGTIVLMVTVSPSGDVADVRVKKSLHSKVDQRVVEAVRNWKYKPALKDGQPAEAVIEVTVRIRIE